MVHKFKLLALAALLAMAPGYAHADTWTLDAGASNLTFASIKNNYVGENHTFSDLSGQVSEDGTFSLMVGLGSLETNIDIRNERMAEHVFAAAPSATFSADIDMAEVEGLGVGETTNFDTFGALDLLGTEVWLDASLFVMRLSDDRVMVTTNGMVFMSTEDAGIDAGIDVLQQLAGLDSITRVSPITLRLVFERAM